MVLELGIAAEVSHIVTFNRKDFRKATEFGITIASPSEFLTLIGSILPAAARLRRGRSMW